MEPKILVFLSRYESWYFIINDKERLEIMEMLDVDKNDKTPWMERKQSSSTKKNKNRCEIRRLI